MNLKFHILWFDDSKDWFESVNLQPLKSTIESWGFEPSISTVFTSAEFATHKPYDDFDLLVVDFNLEDYGEGANFIADVRAHGVFTEVIFYSAKPSSDLWASIHQHQLEGVFVSDRRSILTKIQGVAQHGIKRILDVENMRGIVMAEVGAIDHLLDHVILKAFPRLDTPQKKSFFDSFYAGSKKQLEERAAALEQFNANPDIKILLELSDSSKRWQGIKRLMKGNGPLAGFELGDYQADVLQPRNFLAHGLPKATGKNSYVFEYFGKGYEFNEQIGEKLRHTIMGYGKRFQEMLMKVSGEE